MPPSKIEQHTAYQLLELIEASLHGITQADGYNTDPFVTLDIVDGEAAEATHAHVLTIDTEAHNIEENLPGPSYRASLHFAIYGISSVDGDIPRRVSMALEQDVRTALAASVANIRAKIGKGCVFRFGDCTHDAGALAPKKQAGFVLQCSIRYPQGSTW